MRVACSGSLCSLPTRHWFLLPPLPFFPVFATTRWSSFFSLTLLSARVCDTACVSYRQNCQIAVHFVSPSFRSLSFEESVYSVPAIPVVLYIKSVRMQLIVHECTCADDTEGDIAQAAVIKHSTPLMAAEFLRRTRARQMVLTHFGGSEAHAATAARIETLGYAEALLAWLVLTTPCSSSTRATEENNDNGDDDDDNVVAAVIEETLLSPTAEQWRRRLFEGGATSPASARHVNRSAALPSSSANESNDAPHKLPRAMARRFGALSRRLAASPSSVSRRSLRALVEASRTALSEALACTPDDTGDRRRMGDGDEAMALAATSLRDPNLLGVVHPAGGAPAAIADAIELQIGRIFEVSQASSSTLLSSLHRSRVGAFMVDRYAFPTVTDRSVMAEIAERVQRGSSNPHVLCGRDFMRIHVQQAAAH